MLCAKEAWGFWMTGYRDAGGFGKLCRITEATERG